MGPLVGTEVACFLRSKFWRYGINLVLNKVNCSTYPIDKFPVIMLLDSKSRILPENPHASLSLCVFLQKYIKLEANY